MSDIVRATGRMSDFFFSLDRDEVFGCAVVVIGVCVCACLPTSRYYTATASYTSRQKLMFRKGSKC